MRLGGLLVWKKGMSPPLYRKPVVPFADFQFATNFKVDTDWAAKECVFCIYNRKRKYYVFIFGNESSSFCYV